MILWAYTKPWKNRWQSLAFLIAVLLIPAYVSLEEQGLQTKFLFQMALVSLVALFVLRRLRGGMKLTARFGVKRDGPVKHNRSTVDTLMLVLFYSLCAVYLFLYGPVG
jgi:Ca2+/Na+ antiporter